MKISFFKSNKGELAIVNVILATVVATILLNTTKLDTNNQNIVSNESINSIIEKYNTTIEELEKYNDIKEINIGTKLIIPLKNE